MYYQPEQKPLDETKLTPTPTTAPASVKQEPHMPKAKASLDSSKPQQLEYTTLQPTLTPPSSASSASSTSSNGSGKHNKYNSTPFANTPSSKRKLAAAELKSSTQKPVYSEYLNANCLLYIYYKGDIISVVDEHFKKSFSAPSTKSSSTSRTKSSKQVNSSKLSTTHKDQTSYSWSTSNWTTTTPYPGQSHAHYQPYSHSNPMPQTLVYDNNCWNRPYNQAYTDYNKMYSPHPTQYPSMGFIDQGNGHNIDQATVSNIKDEKNLSAEPSKFLSAVAAYQHLPEPAPATLAYNNSLSSSSSSSLSSSNATGSGTAAPDVNSFVLNAVTNATGYRYPQYLNHHHHNQHHNQRNNPYAQYPGFDLNGLPSDTDSSLAALPAISTQQGYAASVWY